MYSTTYLFYFLFWNFTARKNNELTGPHCKNWSVWEQELPVSLSPLSSHWNTPSPPLSSLRSLRFSRHVAPSSSAARRSSPARPRPHSPWTAWNRTRSTASAALTIDTDGCDDGDGCPPPPFRAVASPARRLSSRCPESPGSNRTVEARSRSRLGGVPCRRRCPPPLYRAAAHHGGGGGCRLSALRRRRQPICWRTRDCRRCTRSRWSCKTGCAAVCVAGGLDRRRGLSGYPAAEIRRRETRSPILWECSRGRAPGRWDHPPTNLATRNHFYSSWW